MLLTLPILERCTAVTGSTSQAADQSPEKPRWLLAKGKSTKQDMGALPNPSGRSGVMWSGYNLFCFPRVAFLSENSFQPFGLDRFAIGLFLFTVIGVDL